MCFRWNAVEENLSISLHFSKMHFSFPLIYISIWRATCWWNENKWQCYLQRDNVLFQNVREGPCFALMTVKCSKWDRQKNRLTHSRRHEKWPSFFLQCEERERENEGDWGNVCVCVCASVCLCLCVCVLLQPLCGVCEMKPRLNQKETLLIYMMSKWQLEENKIDFQHHSHHKRMRI